MDFSLKVRFGFRDIFIVDLEGCFLAWRILYFRIVFVVNDRGNVVGIVEWSKVFVLNYWCCLLCFLEEIID